MSSRVDKNAPPTTSLQYPEFVEGEQQTSLINPVSRKMAEMTELSFVGIGVVSGTKGGASITATDEINLPESDVAALRRKKLMAARTRDRYIDPAVLVVRKIGKTPEQAIEVGYRYRNIRPLTSIDNSDGAMKWKSAADADPAVGSDGLLLFATDRFILQQVSETDSERIGPMYTFGTALTWVAGRSPRIYTYGGMLVDNSKDRSAQAQWLSAYQTYLKGSKCIAMGAFAELYYRDQLRRGYVLHTNLNETSTDPNRAQFAFTMFVIWEGTVELQTLPSYVGPMDNVTPPKETASVTSQPISGVKPLLDVKTTQELASMNARLAEFKAMTGIK